MKDPLRNTTEPIGLASATAIVGALLAVLVSFGLNLTTTQRDAILQVITLAGPLLIWLWARRHTTPLVDPRDDQGNSLVPEDGSQAE